MIKLPCRTEVFKQMPKGIFVKHLNNSNVTEKNFMDEIVSIVWINKLSPETMIISQGKMLTEIAVVEIFLNRQVISQNLLEILNKEIDQPTVFIARYEEWGQIWCAINQSGNISKAKGLGNTYYQTNWQPYDALELIVAGDDLDQVYENFSIQISGKPIPAENGNSQKDPVDEKDEPVEFEPDKQVAELETVIKKIKTQINHEKQFKQQVKLMVDLKNAKEKLLKIKTPETNQMELIRNNIEMIQSSFPHVFVNMTEDNENQFYDTATDYRILKIL